MVVDEEEEEKGVLKEEEETEAVVKVLAITEAVVKAMAVMKVVELMEVATWNMVLYKNIHRHYLYIGHAFPQENL